MRLHHAPVEATAPTDDGLTDYDRSHLITYLRLLDADAENAHWREVVRIVMNLDPDSDGAEQCHASHLARARWMTIHGYHHLLGGNRTTGTRSSQVH